MNKRYNEYPERCQGAQHSDDLKYKKEHRLTANQPWNKFNITETNAAFFWARELVFTIFTSTKTVPKHSRELEIS